jgi:hypothetical protein
VTTHPSRFKRWTRKLLQTLAPLRTTEITIETDRVVVVRRRRSVRGWCRQCCCEVELVPLKDAAMISGLAAELLVERGAPPDWHVVGPLGGAVHVCLPSLVKNR